MINYNIGKYCINGRKFRQDRYLKTWWAYRRPPEGKED